MMKALVFEAREKMSVQDVSVPELQPNGALLKVMANGWLNADWGW